jgi:hypothetical protein
VIQHQPAPVGSSQRSPSGDAAPAPLAAMTNTRHRDRLWLRSFATTMRVVRSYSLWSGSSSKTLMAATSSPRRASAKRPFVKSDGILRLGCWLWNGEGVPPIPHWLPELRKALGLNSAVLIVEGEGKVDRLRFWNVPATCCGDRGPCGRSIPSGTVGPSLVLGWSTMLRRVLLIESILRESLNSRRTIAVKHRNG